MDLDDDLTEEDLAKLAKDGTNEERRAVAVHPNASLQTLRELAEAGFAEDVDQNPLLPLHVEGGSDEAIPILAEVAKKTERSERLEELASSVWNDVRLGVASNANTPPTTLSLLAKDKEWHVRLRVAENANTPPTTLSLLAKDMDDYVRRGVAENANTPPTTLSILAMDKDEGVRFRVADNANTPPATLSLGSGRI